MGLAVAHLLRDLADETGVSRRELARRTPVSYARIRTAFSGEASILVDELDAIARALGTKGSVILARAEDDLYGPVERSRPPFQLRDEDVGDELKAAKDAPYSPEAEYEQ